MSKKPFSLGSDPELILLSEEGPLSAEGIIGHGKFDPLDLGEGYAVHEDNILVEFNTPPAKNSIEFLRSHVKALKVIHDKFLKDKNIRISKECFAEYDPKYLQTEQALPYSFLLWVSLSKIREGTPR